MKAVAGGFRMWVVKLSGDIMRIYSAERLSYLKSLGYFVTGSYIDALSYSGCLKNKGRDSRLYRYAEYF